ncbi:MAG: hypothetical protein IRY91_17700, partial [Gemmatimonadaceae bacterium]|nr:hypothetical protein [Gemmatimonadaceae bacterium]
VGDSAADDAAIMSPDAPRRSPRRARRDPLSRPARLAGIAQTLGLAIGAPEFQRR